MFSKGLIHIDTPVLADQQKKNLNLYTGCRLEDLPSVISERERWWERIKEIYVFSMPWWWWFIEHKVEREPGQIFLSDFHGVWFVSSFQQEKNSIKANNHHHHHHHHVVLKAQTSLTLSGHSSLSSIASGRSSRLHPVSEQSCCR